MVVLHKPRSSFSVQYTITISILPTKGGVCVCVYERVWVHLLLLHYSIHKALLNLTNVAEGLLLAIVSSTTTRLWGSQFFLLYLWSYDNLRWNYLKVFKMCFRSDTLVVLLNLEMCVCSELLIPICVSYYIIYAIYCEQKL